MTWQWLLYGLPTPQTCVRLNFFGFESNWKFGKLSRISSRLNNFFQKFDSNRLMTQQLLRKVDSSRLMTFFFEKLNRFNSWVKSVFGKLIQFSSRLRSLFGNFIQVMGKNRGHIIPIKNRSLFPPRFCHHHKKIRRPFRSWFESERHFAAKKKLFSWIGHG